MIMLAGERTCYREANYSSSYYGCLDLMRCLEVECWEHGGGVTEGISDLSDAFEEERKIAGDRWWVRYGNLS